MDLVKFGKTLREKRKELGLTPTKLTERADISKATLWIWEEAHNPKTGKPSQPSYDKLRSVIAALRLRPEEESELLELAGYTPQLLNSDGAAQVMQRVGTRLGFGAGISVVSLSRTEKMRLISHMAESIQQMVEALLQEEE